jgi:hypothetical protein
MRRKLSAAFVLASVVSIGACGGGGADPRTIVDPVALLGLAHVLDSCTLASPSVHVNDTTDTLHKGMGDGCFYTGQGTCSLRDAVSFSNLRTWTCGASRNTHIALPAGTYQLTQATERALEVDGELLIHGEGAETTIIEGGPRAASNASIALGLPVGIDSVFRVSKRGSLSAEGVTIRYGNSPGPGGGIDSAGYLTLAHSVVADNRAAGPGGGIFGGGQPVALADSVVSGNIARDDGGGIAAVSATLTRSAVRSNTAARGGGVATAGSTRLVDTVVSGNRARVLGGGLFNDRFATTRGFNATFDANGSDADGGGIANVSNGQVELTRSTIRGNEAKGGNGGGVYNVYAGYEVLGPATGSYVTLIDSSVVENAATPGAGFKGGAGGGICNTDDDFHPLGITYPRPWASVSLRNSVVARNRALGAGGILNQGAESRVWVEGSEISRNEASFWVGGVANGGILDLRDSTVAGNRGANGAGGVLNAQTATLVNATISGNSATSSGVGGIVNTTGSSAPGGLTLTNSTVASNGTGIATWPGAGPFKVQNTILANGPAGANCPWGVVGSEGHNLESGSSCGFTKPSDLQNADPRLGPLAVNAPGARATHALPPGSPAVDAGGDSTNGCPPTDARGVPRPRGAGCDIGAYELEN